MEQVLYPLPDRWSYTELASLCKFENGDRGKNYPSRDAFVESGIPVINAGNLDGRKIVEAGLNYITRERYDILGSGKVRQGDLLFCLRGSLGKCAIVSNLNEGAIASSLVIVRPSEALDPNYLLYFFNSSLCATFIERYNNGAAQPNLSAKSLSKFLIPLASREEQKRIVEKLDALLTRIDTAIEHLQESVTLADALYASELNKVFPSDADIESLSAKAGWVSLSDICIFENGDRGKNYPSKSAFVAEGIPVVSAGNLGERYIDHKGLNYITPERYDLLRSGRIKIGDILFCLRGSLGKVAISKDINEGVIASSLVIIRPKEHVSAEYIYRYLRSSLCQKFISYYNNGAAQPNLSAKSLGRFMLPLPNADEQKIIVEALDEKYQLSQKLLDALRNKINHLQSLKASILDSAFKGEL
jgi:type I restriction enzyme S subunit